MRNTHAYNYKHRLLSWHYGDDAGPSFVSSKFKDRRRKPSMPLRLTSCSDCPRLCWGRFGHMQDKLGPEEELEHLNVEEVSLQ